MAGDYDPAADPVHGSGWNSAARWGGWDWRCPGYGEHFRTCSFCGSIHPEDLAAERQGSGCAFPGCPDQHNELAPTHFPVEGRPGQEGKDGYHLFMDTGWRASWADRKYGWPHKFYVEGLRPRDPSLLHCTGSKSGPEAPDPGYMGMEWHRVKDCPRKLIKVAKADGMVYSAENKDGWLGFATRASMHAKFYTKHLADPRVSDEVKDKIARVSGLRFTFDDGGRVYWEPVTA